MSVRILTGDCRQVLATLPDESVHCVVTSPPYFGLRDYGVDGQIGLEASPDAFVAEMVAVFREVRRALRKDGTLWLNLGDSYANDSKWGGSTSGKHARGNHGDSGIGRRRHNSGLKSKDLMMIPARVAIALQADGWYLRSDIIWAKPNPMPESITDRPTSAHEHVFLLSRSERYFYDHAAVREKAVVPTWEDGSRTFGGVNKHGANLQHGDRTTGRTTAPRKSAPRGSFNGKTEAMADAGKNAFRAVVAERNLRNVWTVASQPFAEAHFATFPPALIEPCIKAGCPAGGVVLDPFGGAGTTALVADRLGRDALLIELNPTYATMARDRLSRDGGMFASVAAE